MSMFKAATRRRLKLRMTLDGPTGSGKSYTAQRFARGIAGPNARVAVIDTEHRSMSKYKGEAPDGVPWDFDVCELEHYAPSTYTQVIREAGRAGYDVLIIDSLSHAWEGVGGALDQIDKKGGSSFTAWKEVTPMHREMVEAILSCPCHVIVTMRSKMDYVLEEQTNKQGRTVQVPKKVGMQPVQRAGMEYEFDLVCDMTIDHTLTVAKTRCSAMDGARAVKPGPEFVAPLKQWLDEGVAEEQPAPQFQPQQQQEQPKQQARPQAQPQAQQPQQRQPQQQQGGIALGGHSEQTHAIQDSDYCQSDHREQIVTLAEQLGLGPDDIRGVLAKRGASRIAELTVGQAEELIAKMRQRYQEASQNTPF